MKDSDLCANCGHKRCFHQVDSFGRNVCDKATDYPDGTYDFECDCSEFKEVKNGN